MVLCPTVHLPVRLPEAEHAMFSLWDQTALCRGGGWLGWLLSLALTSGLLSPDGTEYGLSEADMEASYATVKSMAEQIEADVILLRERQEAGGRVRDYLVRKRVGDNDFLEVR